MRVLVILNAAAGTLLASTAKNEADVIRDRFASLGVEAEVRHVPGPQLHAVTSEARDAGAYDMIVAGGGDGTLNTIASALVGSTVPFGVLPLGTFNHLAKELGTPLELEPAIDALVAGRTVPFNVGRVNDRHFLLFAAVGLYSDMIRHRDAQRKALGRAKMWAGTIAFVRMLFRWPLMRVVIRKVRTADGDGPAIARLTPGVYVSLSEYQMQQMGLVNVPADAREAMSVLVSPQVERRGLVWLIIKGAFRRLRIHRDLELIRADAFELVPRGRDSIRVGYDGEVETMTSPLTFGVIKAALQMRVPATAVATADAPLESDAPTSTPSPSVSGPA